MSDNWVGVIALVMTSAVIVGWPLARAYARRMDRGASRSPLSPPDVISRLDRIEQSLEAVATEVERISEGQRFTTKLLADPRGSTALAPAAAETIPKGTVLMDAARRQ